MRLFVSTYFTVLGLPGNELVSGEKPATAQETASVTTAKTTLAHHATMKARDQAYQVSGVHNDVRLSATQLLNVKLKYLSICGILWNYMHPDRMVGRILSTVFQS